MLFEYAPKPEIKLPDQTFCKLIVSYFCPSVNGEFLFFPFVAEWKIATRPLAHNTAPSAPLRRGRTFFSKRFFNRLKFLFLSRRVETFMYKSLLSSVMTSQRNFRPYFEREFFSTLKYAPPKNATRIVHIMNTKKLLNFEIFFDCSHRPVRTNPTGKTTFPFPTLRQPRFKTLRMPRPEAAHSLLA